MKAKVKFSHLPRFNAVRDLYIAEVSVSPNEWSSLDFYEESLAVLGEVMEKDGEVRLTYDRFGHPLHAVVEWQNTDGHKKQISVDRSEIKRLHPDWRTEKMQVWLGWMHPEEK